MKVFGKHAASTALLLSLTVLLFCIVCGDETSMQDVEEEQFEHSSDQNIEDLVLVLDKGSWARTAMAHPLLLVYFSASWCGYCRQLTPEYYKAAAILQKEDSDVPFVMMESSDFNKDLLDKFKITRYPTVMLVVRGVPSTIYRGDYDASSIAQFVRGTSSDSVSDVNSVAELDSFLAAVRDNSHYTPDALVVLGLEQSTDADERANAPLTTFRAAAQARHPGDAYGPFALSRGNNELFKRFLSKHIKEREGGNVDGFFIVILSIDQTEPIGIEKLYPESGIDDLLRYVDSFHLPVILKYHESNLKRIQWFASGIQVLIFAPSSGDNSPYTQRWPEWLAAHSTEETNSDITPWDKAGDLFLGVVSQVADRYRGRVLFIHVPESEFHIYQIFHVSRKDGFNPEAVVVDLRQPGQMVRYQMSSYHKYESLSAEAMGEIAEGLNSGKDMMKALSVEKKGTKVDAFRSALEQLISDASKKKLDPSIVSEDIGGIDSSESGAVNKIVASTFVDEISDENVDLYLVAFVAPWCGHCKALEPVLDTLSRYFTTSGAAGGAPNVKIGKVDATKNEITYPQVKIFGYPTIYFFKKEQSQNDPICSDGGNTAGSLCESTVDEVRTEIKVIEYDGQRTVRELKKAVRVLSSA